MANRNPNLNFGRNYGYDRGMYRGNARRYNVPLYGDEVRNQGEWNNYDYDYDVDPGRANSNAWPTAGPYQGVGPSDYQRSDASIREEINERLTRHGQINASDIHVGVEAGVVTLTGAVASRKQKRTAGDVADAVSGVRDVNNELKIEE